MPTLVIKNLHCIETEDNWGADDAYIIVNGRQVWGPQSMDDNQWREVADENGSIRVPFTGMAIIELHEVDDADSDDFLGQWPARSDEQGRGDLRAFFNADDCNYEMFYEVLG